MAVKPFEALYADYAQEIRRLSATQFVPGMEPEDVASEMMVALWKASQSYNPRGRLSFGQWWWTVWLNRRSDLAGIYHATKRIHPVPVEDAVLSAFDKPDSSLAPFPRCPSDDPLDRNVWRLLAEGHNAREVITYTAITRRRYYAMIHRWRTEEVRERLRTDG